MDEDKDFTVRDRRSGPTDAGAGAGPKPSADTGDRSADQEPDHEHGIDFSTFVISLASSAQVNLGAIPHPETKQTSRNFPAAKQMIDILELLQAKTRGNLTEEEAGLLEQVLFNLRVHYVRTIQGQK